MKRILSNAALLIMLLSLGSCASGSYMQTVSYWHFGNLLQFALIAVLAIFVYFIYTRIQSIDSTLKEILEQMRSGQNRNAAPGLPDGNNVQPAQPTQAPQPEMKKCPDCGAVTGVNVRTCPNCGCPLD